MNAGMPPRQIPAGRAAGLGGRGAARERHGDFQFVDQQAQHMGDARGARRGQPVDGGRPSSTALAPRARALSTSVPRRMPPSTNSGSAPAGRLQSVPARGPRRVRYRACGRRGWRRSARPRPARRLCSASCGCSTPLSSTGSRVCDCSHCTSSQVGACSTRPWHSRRVPSAACGRDGGGASRPG